MEVLKEIFGKESLSYEQLEAKLAEKKMKLADLSTGDYVGKGKYEEMLAERDNLKARLDEANGKLEGYDPEWQKKAAQAENEAKQEMEKLRRGYTIREQVSGIKFSSDAAKRSFISDLESQHPVIQDGKVLGLTDFVEKYKERDPGAILPDDPLPRFAAPGQGKPPVKKETEILDAKYGKNPFYKSKGE